MMTMRISLGFLVVLALAALAAPSLLGETTVSLVNRLAAPSWGHVLGTDDLGRDVLTRLLAGARVSLMIGLVAALGSALIGTIVGIVAGFFGGGLDKILMRVTDSVIALPLLPLLIILSALDPGKLGIPESIAGSDSFSLYRIVFIIALFGWTTSARLVRAATLQVKSSDFILAAQALGLSDARIMLRHIFPNITGPLIVATTLSVGNIILMESVLSFLGLGITPPTSSWGNMLTNAQDIIWEAPSLAVYPGLMIFLTVMAFNFLGDGLRERFDPKSEKLRI